jgi:hypothetical protein
MLASEGMCRVLPTTGERVRKAAEETDGETLPAHRPETEVARFATSQRDRASSAGVSRYTQRKLDRLARDFPELHGKVCSGEMERTHHFVSNCRPELVQEYLFSASSST